MANQQKPDTYTITVTGDGTRVQKDVPSDVAVEVIRLVTSVRTRPALSDEMLNPIRVRQPDLGEYLEVCRAANNPERITATAMFLRELGFNSFDRELMRATLRKADFLPANLPRDVATARDLGWLHESAVTTGDFALTTEGISAVKSQFGRPPE